MHLKGTEGTEFDLRIKGYEFAGSTGIAVDANWLNVEVTVHSREDQWQSTAPCLVVGEAHALSAWLWKLSKGEAVDKELEFLEPNLRFAWSLAAGDAITIRVLLDGELLPSWVSSKGFGVEGRLVDVTVCRGDLFDAFWSLQVQLRSFPPRAGRE